MRSSIRLIAVWLFCFAVAAAQQERATHQLVVPLAKGGFIGFRSETQWAKTKNGSQFSRATSGVFTSEALLDENHVIHRLLLDASGETVFGYDLLVEPDTDTRKFKIAVKPLDPKFEIVSKTNYQRSLPTKKPISTLRKSAEPQILDDGDAFALDLLINETMGVKIVDIVKVSFDRSNLWEVNPRTLPRDFTVDAVELELKDYRLLLNGDVVAVGKPSHNYSGALIWLYLQDHGRFIFSLTPREGYEFRKAGVIQDNKILFDLNGDHYELISGVPILRGGGSWNLWVLQDRNFTPLISKPQPAEPNKKDSLERLDAAVKAMQERARIMRTEGRATLGPTKEKGTIVTQAPHVKQLELMIGSADKLEELFPPP